MFCHLTGRLVCAILVETITNMTHSIIPASQFTFDDLLAAFNAGYEGYIIPFRMAAEQFRGHLNSHSIDLSASRLIVDDGTITGIALLGVRGSRGWVGGIGIVPAFRNRGLGRELMNALRDSAQALALTSLQLEVITGNEAAYHLYQKVGYETLRRLYILKRTPAPPAASPALLRAVAPVEVLAHFERLHSTANSWQREPESLLRQVDGLSAWIVEEEGRVTAYGLARGQAGSIQWFDLAGATQQSLEGLVAAVHKLYPEADARIVNIPADDPAYQVLTDAGYVELLSQWEMKLAL